MNKGVKYDQDKPRWGLLPFKELEAVVDVLTSGSKKYSDGNWKIVPNAEERYFDAMLRHISQYRYGEKNDSETGKSHLAHAMCCSLFLLWFDNNPDAERFYDDEPKKDKLDLTKHDCGASFNLKPDDIKNYRYMTIDAMLKKISDAIKDGSVELETLVCINVYDEYYEYVGKDAPHFKFKEISSGKLEFYTDPKDIPEQVSVEDLMDRLQPLKDDPTRISPSPMNPLNRLIGDGVASLTTEPDKMKMDEIVESIDNIILDIENGTGVCAPRPSVDTIPVVEFATDPKKEPRCCYYNMGNVKQIFCTPEEILECLQSNFDANDHIGNDWFNSTTMQCMHLPANYAYVGSNSTEHFFFKLIDNKFERVVYG